MEKAEEPNANKKSTTKTRVFRGSANPHKHQFQYQHHQAELMRRVLLRARSHASILLSILLLCSQSTNSFVDFNEQIHAKQQMDKSRREEKSETVPARGVHPCQLWERNRFTPDPMEATTPVLATGHLYSIPNESSSVLIS
jgi:hypothetical protein